MLVFLFLLLVLFFKYVNSFKALQYNTFKNLFAVAHLHQNPSNPYEMGLPDHLQCFYNVNFKQYLSNKIVKKNDNSLLNIKRYLKKYDLLNNKNLIKRKDIYYFTFYLQKDKNISFSLNTKDFFLSNILKYKILLKLKEEIKKMDFEEEYLKQFNTSLTIFKTDSGININVDDE